MDAVAQGRFEGRTALVTGAGSGIGKATARRLLDEGATVLGVDRHGDALVDLAESNPRFTALTVELGSDAAVRTVADEVSRRTDHLDLLVNNAGIFLMAGVDATWEQWRTITDVNLISPAMLTAALADLLARSTLRSVVNVASVSGHVAQPDRWTYNSVKGAILSLTRCQALDLAERGIRVNSVSPGYVWTDVLERASGGDRAQWDPRWGRSAMMGRCSDPEEVASVIAFLASSDASYVTGADLLVDGGMVAMSTDGTTAYDYS